MSKTLKSELLKQYTKNVAKLRERARAHNISDEQLDKLFKECFEELRTRQITNKTNAAKVTRPIYKLTRKILISSTLVFIVVYILLNYHQTTSSIVLRNVQGLIYPGLKLLRLLAIPILKHFPSLTYLYDETCLVENPFFYVYDMECWPCENVHAVLNLTNFKNHSLYQQGIPYIVRSNQPLVTFRNLTHLYHQHRDIFDRDAKYVKASDSSIKTVNELFTNFVPNESSNKHLSWRINRMHAARYIRTLFPKPYIVPDRVGQGMERYVMVDEPKADRYILPNMECSYIFMVQGSGERTIVLKPSKECGSTCKTVSVLLKPSYVLLYNWWYWRPISLPVEGSKNASISYINCYYY